MATKTQIIAGEPTRVVQAINEKESKGWEVRETTVLPGATFRLLVVFRSVGSDT